MTPDHPWMWHWGGMWFFPIIMFGVVIIFFYLLFRRGGCRPPWWNPEEHFREKEKAETAIEILKKRYAKGEITKDEFEEMKKVILND